MKLMNKISKACIDEIWKEEDERVIKIIMEVFYKSLKEQGIILVAEEEEI